MKILFLERSLGRGGAQRQLVQLAIGLMRRGHTVTVALFYNEGPLISEITKHGVGLRILDKKHRWDVFNFLRGLLALLKFEKPDILCTFLPVPNLVALVCKLFRSSLKLVWGVRASNVNVAHYDRLTRWSYELEVFGARFANLIISNSAAGQRTVVAKGFPSRKVMVIPNGIDTDRFRYDPFGRQQLRRSWNVADTDILVGIIGRLDPMKDHRTFLRAAAIAATRVENIRFVCVGDEGPILRRDLEAFAGAIGLNGIVWSNGRDDMPAVFSACDVVCSSSAYGEGFSNTLAEAMACGRRCVATDVGDAKEIIDATGCIVPPSDEKELASGIVTLCQQIARYGADNKAASKRIQETFSVDVMVHRFENEFRRLASGTKHS